LPYFGGIDGRNPSRGYARAIAHQGVA
jgi:hypothetical protein